MPAAGPTSHIRCDIVGPALSVLEKKGVVSAYDTLHAIVSPKFAILYRYSTAVDTRGVGSVAVSRPVLSLVSRGLE
jgi:hypothetical protein